MASHKSPPSSAVFLDRDGTLNVDTGYLHDWSGWRWLPGAPEGLALLQKAGFRLVVASNQSGIARGFYTEEDLRRLNTQVNADLAGYGARIDAFYSCPHLPGITGPCQCRKPLPGMILRAAQELNLDLRSSWMIGDKPRDAEAALAAGCKAILVGSSLRGAPPGTELCPDFMAAAMRILQAHRPAETGTSDDLQ